MGHKPDETLVWKTMNEAIPEWNENKLYAEGDIVTYSSVAEFLSF